MEEKNFRGQILIKCVSYLNGLRNYSISVFLEVTRINMIHRNNGGSELEMVQLPKNKISFLQIQSDSTLKFVTITLAFKFT
jgi:hypothetical protein